MIEEKYIEVYDPGDESVGIFPARFTMQGDFFFENEEGKEDFRKLLKEAFDLVTDAPVVMFGAEIDKMSENIVNKEDNPGWCPIDFGEDSG